MDELLDKFCKHYQRLDGISLDWLPDIYADDIQFSDPVLSLTGLDKLTSYLEHGLHGVQLCRFDIFSRLCQGDEACLRWNMSLQHPKLNRGQLFVVPGVSLLRLDKKIIEHHDYYDLGAMVYEHIPLFGGVVKGVKKRIGLP